MTPTQQQMLTGKIEWAKRHEGIAYQVSFWGHGSMCDGAGIWNGYVDLEQPMFSEADWSRFVMPATEHNWNGRVSKDWSYDDFPVRVGNGITFYELKKHWDRHVNGEVELVTAGCDYGHSWDRDMGYPATLDSVSEDMRRTIDDILKLCPVRNERCAYTADWGSKDQMYTAKNGRRCKLGCGVEWPDWQPAETSSAA